MVTLRTSKRNRKPLKLRLLDISRAHFYGHAQREIFVTLPEGDQEEGMVGLLLKSMYGTRDAAHIWQQSYTDVLLAAGFKRSAAWPAIFFHERLEARLLVHGDDFVILGDDAAQEFVEKALRGKYDLRVDGSIGVGEAKQEFCVLNRLVHFRTLRRAVRINLLRARSTSRRDLAQGFRHGDVQTSQEPKRKANCRSASQKVRTGCGWSTQDQSVSFAHHASSVLSPRPSWFVRDSQVPRTKDARTHRSWFRWPEASS